MQQLRSRSAARNPRPLGRPPKISREAVIAAAVDLGLEVVTIQAVATRLGVSRTAIYRHVDNSWELRSLVAQATLTEFEFDAPATPDNWQTWLVDVAHAGRQWRLANAPAEPYMSVGSIEAGGFLDTVERTLEVLENAGFEPQTAARALEFLAGVVWINTHDQLVAEATEDGMHPQQREFVEAGLHRLDEYPLLQRNIGGDEFLGAAERRFAFEVRGVVAALEAELEQAQDADARDGS